MKNKRLTLIICSLVFWVPSFGQSAVRSYIEQLKSSDELKEAVWGLKAVKADGRVVVEYNSETRMLPASNQKLITTGIALNELGADYRFNTSLAYSGMVKDSVLVGDLYIVGGADPTIGALGNAETEALFSSWEKMLEGAGISSIDGRIIGDGRYLDGESRNLSWLLEDAFCGDGAVMNGLSFNENLQKFTVKPGPTVGSGISLSVTYPLTPWMEWNHSCLTGPSGTGNSLYYNCTDLIPYAGFGGTYAMGLPERSITVSNPFGTLTCAYYFYRFLEDRGFSVSKGPADVDNKFEIRTFVEGSGTEKAKDPDSLHPIGSTSSSPVSELIIKTNHDSDNFYAETLLRVISRNMTASSCYDSCSTAMGRALEKMGVNNYDRMQFKDGSGLSRKNYVSPAFMVDFLDSMRSSSEFETYLNSIPRPGSGTLSTRLQSESQSVKSRVYMKSGSMNGVRCFSGYILPTSGNVEDLILFSFMTNNTVVTASRINFIMDKVIGLIAREN